MKAIADAMGEGMSWTLVLQVGILMFLGVLLVNTAINNIVSHYWKEAAKADELYHRSTQH